MMETFSEKTRAYLYALIVHLAVFASLFIGLLWTQPVHPVATPGPTIEADLVGPSAAPRAHATSKPKPEPPKPPQPAPEPPTPEPPKPEPPKPADAKQPPPTVQRNDNKEQEKIDEFALQKAEQAKHEQEEKHKQQQIKLEDEQRKEAEAKERQQQIQKQLEDIRKERAAAAKQTKLAQEKMKQLDDLQKEQSQPAKPVREPPADVPEAPERKTGSNGTDTSLLAEYSSAIIKVVTDNWNRPDTVQPGLRCAVHVIQLPGGTVMDAKAVSPCNADQVTRTSIEQAVTKAQPLPYKGYESVFQREITFIFKYDGN